MRKQKRHSRIAVLVTAVLLTRGLGGAFPVNAAQEVTSEDILDETDGADVLALPEDYDPELWIEEAETEWNPALPEETMINEEAASFHAASSDAAREGDWPENLIIEETSLSAGTEEESLAEPLEEFVVEEPLVSNGDLSRSLPGAGIRKKAAASSGAQESAAFTCYGDQLGEAARRIYDFRKNYYVTGRRVGTLQYLDENGEKTSAVTDTPTNPRQFLCDKLTFTNLNNTIYSFTAPLTQSGTLDRTSPEYLTAYQDILEICQSATDAYNYDFPQMFWTRSASYTIGYGSLASTLKEGEDGVSTKTFLVTSVTYTAVEAFPGAAHLVGAFDAAVPAVAETIQASSDYDQDGTVTANELVQGIHDYIVQRCYYDNTTLNQYRANKNKGFSAYNIFCSAGIFLEDVGSGIVCEGYARGTKVLCDYFGIPCACVGGPVSSGADLPHMWNVVSIDGVWYLLDVTWDDQRSNYSLFLTATDGVRTPNSYISGPENSQTIASINATVTYPSKAFTLPRIGSDEHSDQVENAEESPCTGYVAHTCPQDGITWWERDLNVASIPGHMLQTDGAVPPTCTETGKTEGVHCSRCGKVFQAQEVLPAAGHQVVTEEAVSATCTSPGHTQGRYCALCGLVLEPQTALPATGHAFRDGVCSRCGQRQAPVSLGNAKVTVKDVTASGKKLTPKVQVTLSGKPLVLDRDYTLRFVNNRYVGRAWVVVTGKGIYTDSTIGSFRILPRQIKTIKMKLTSLGKVKVTWKKRGSVTSYQVQYALSGNFSSPKTIKVKGNKRSCILKKCKRGRRYYLRIRPCKKVNGVVCYGPWSKVQKIQIP